MRTTAVLHYNMSTADSNDPFGVVPVGRLLEFIGDVETEIVILHDGDESLALGYNDVKVYEEVYVGDQLDFKASLLKAGNTSREILMEVWKVASTAARAGKTGAHPEEMVHFDPPKLVMNGKVILIVGKERQRGAQPDGVVSNPWREIS
ncbi:MAG: beta-alanyl-CoA:ammonia lyase [Deltaproteobacteria bacterium]|nr:beta-alanyl-CoA:ammonia lyase [Deltaproteobacteria bacterium]